MNEPATAIEAERSVLGSVLLGPTVMAALVVDEKLHPEHFYRPRHGAIWEAMTALYDRAEPIDRLTVAAELRWTSSEDLDLLGSLAGHVVMAANYRAHARQIIEAALLRQTRRVVVEITDALDRKDWDAIREAQGQLVPAVEPDRVVSPETLAHRVYERMERDLDDAWPFPFERLTDLTAGGMRRGQVTYLGAWTSYGKTVLLDQCLEHGAKHGATVRLYTNEMSDEDRVLRRISRETGISFMRLLRGRLRDGEHPRFLTALDRFRKTGFPIVSASGMSAQEIRHDVMRIRPDLVGLDIVHEIPYEDEKDLRRIAQTLTQTAREAGCHVLAAVHLNDARSVGHYPPAPALRDIKGASAIRQGADNVLLLHRFEEEQEGRGTGDPGEDAEVHVAKVRNGILGKQRLRFEGRLMRFELPFDAATVGIAA